jgi:hypothetical protein
MAAAGLALARRRRLSPGGSDDVWPVLAWRRGAAKLGGGYGVATSVEAWPPATVVVAPLLWP